MYCIVMYVCLSVSVCLCLSLSVSVCLSVPRLPHKVKVDVAKRHACHTNSCGVRHTGPKRATRASPVPSVPCLTRRMHVDVAKRYASLTK